MELNSDSHVQFRKAWELELLLTVPHAVSAMDFLVHSLERYF
jgi:hypothetical protein